ncbi:helix-turn-helix domain-containing protein [Umezawaea beigongshangensis]|uniref:helix-turn-helix domain-containing protein n=1 Tax=Umezawaea beigongshangensis TaxID=2780383 RepID=UPI0018F1DF9A|nr:helix-turn-helix transcriptional regulator [Umezawaea beigongshangensis]
MEYSIPAIRRLQLGRVLRELRKRASLSIDQVGPDLDVSASTLNRIECGRARVHPLVVRGALDLFGVPFETVEDVMALAREAYRNTWWTVQGIAADSYVALETEAVAARNFELALIPGLLQVEDYARALFTLDPPAERERYLRIRMERAARLTGDRPIDLHAVVDETVLTRPVGGRRVLTEQVRHLVEMAQLPDVRLQVLPVAVGASRGLRGAFSLLSFPPDTIDDLAYVDHPAGNLQLSKPAKVKELTQRFDRIARVALDEHESLELLRGLVRD